MPAAPPEGALQFRAHGPATALARVVVIHGGPGSVGSAGALAALLADPARVLEPWQRGHTVAGHIADLRAFLGAHCADPPVIVGHSWGAMLALAFAAAHPRAASALCLVCSGTWDLTSRAYFQAHRDEPYLIDPLPDDPLDAEQLDEAAHRATWDDMLRLQADGTYPQVFADIHVPVLMVHGADDPHPGRMIRDSLAPYLPQLHYEELPRCSHYPWRERAARAPFLALVRAWLERP